MIVLRPPGYYSYLDPGLIHTERGFADAARLVADDCTIQAGIIFTEEGLDDLAARALGIFLAARVEYMGTNVALAVYQAISERMPRDKFTWAVEGLEDILRSWPAPSPIERAKAVPEQREPAPEKPLRMPEELDSPELIPIVPTRIAPVPVEPEEAVPVEVVPPLEVEVPPVEVEVPPILRPPVVSPEDRRRPPAEVIPRVGVPVEIERPPTDEVELERPPSVSEVAEEIAEKIGELTGLDYGEIRKIVQDGVDRLSERLKDPGLLAEVITGDEVEIDEEWVKEQWKRDFRLTKEASAEIMEGQETEGRDWLYPVSLPGQE